MRHPGRLSVAGLVRLQQIVGRFVLAADQLRLRIRLYRAGGNVICRVPPGQGPRIGADVNKYMIALLDAVGNRGWLPLTPI